MSDFQEEMQQYRESMKFYFAKNAQNAAKGRAASYQPTNKKILIIDDEWDILKSLALMLKDKYIVNVAENGALGLAIALGWKPDLIILDWMMPRLNGKQFLNIIRRNQALASTPVILISAHNTPAAHRATSTWPIDAFLAKPFEFEQIIAAIEKSLHNHQIEQAV